MEHSFCIPCSTLQSYSGIVDCGWRRRRWCYVVIFASFSWCVNVCLHDNDGVTCWRLHLPGGRVRRCRLHGVPVLLVESCCGRRAWVRRGGGGDGGRLRPLTSLQPGMTQTLFRRGPSTGIVLQHRQQKIGELLGVLLRPLVALHQLVDERSRLQLQIPAEMSLTHGGETDKLHAPLHVGDLSPSVPNERVCSDVYFTCLVLRGSKTEV